MFEMRGKGCMFILDTLCRFEKGCKCKCPFKFPSVLVYEGHIMDSVDCLAVEEKHERGGYLTAAIEENEFLKILMLSVRRILSSPNAGLVRT